MRRVATLVVAIGFTVTGIGTCGAIGHEMPGRSARPAGLTRVAVLAGPGRPGAPAGPAGAKVVRFAGYTIDVPANWPVYRLDRDPARCVRYDRHAIYLGKPGGDPLCPAHLVGRVATIAWRRAGRAGAGPGGRAGPDSAGPLWGPVMPGLSLGHPRVGGVLLQDSQDHQLWGTYGHRGLTLTATYGTDQALMGSIIRTLRW